VCDNYDSLMCIHMKRLRSTVILMIIQLLQLSYCWVKNELLILLLDEDQGVSEFRKLYKCEIGSIFRLILCWSFKTAMSGPASFSLLCVCNVMTTCPYFDKNFKFDISMQWSLEPAYRVLRDIFMCPLTPRLKTDLQFCDFYYVFLTTPVLSLELNLPWHSQC